MSERILVVEDDKDISELIKLHLEEEGFDILLCQDGREGLKAALDESFSLVILDLMLPGMDGRDICRKIRVKDRRIPILILSLKSDVMDKVLGLEEGADDYMTKPFRIQELVARVKALLRRIERREEEEESDESQSDLLVYGELSINVSRREVAISGELVNLTPKEYSLLQFFAEHPGQVFSRSQILDFVWGYEASGYEHTVDSHVNRLRSKIEPDKGKPSFILTVWGVGYRFAEKGEVGKAGV